MERSQLIELLLSEYSYWRDSPRPVADGDRNVDLDIIALGAMGAVANVLAAVMGHPAPWHPSEKSTMPAQETKAP